MNQKKEDTTAYILAKVAPIFNRQGYIGTSLRDITEVTGLTKGAIYGNFENKADLAVKSFRLSVDLLISPMIEIAFKEKNSIKRLYAITHYYRDFYDLCRPHGGCPILNASVDAKFNNREVFNAAQDVSDRLVRNLTVIINKGIKKKEIKKKVDAYSYAKIIFSMIEGGIFMASIHKDKEYLTNILDQVDKIIKKKLKA